MAALQIEIINCSAVLYHGTKELEAHAGNSKSIKKWIEDMMTEYGNLHVSGWHRLKVLQDKEEAIAKEKEDAKKYA